jgi:hypothetical protein
VKKFPIMSHIVKRKRAFLMQRKKQAQVRMAVVMMLSISLSSARPCLLSRSFQSGPRVD